MSDRGDFQPPKEVPKTGERMFGFVKDIKDKTSEIETARFERNFDRLARLLNNKTLLENLVVRKGGGNYLKLLEWSVEALYKELTGASFTKSLSPEAVQQLQTEGHLDPIVLAELANAWYHLKKSRESRKLAAVLADETTASPALVRANALNCLASLDFRQGKPKEAGALNRQAFGIVQAYSGTTETEKQNMVWQELKIEHGLIIDRAKTRPWLDMETQLGAIAAERQKMGDTLLVGRTYLDMARILADVKQIDRARHYLDKAMVGLEEVGYENALVDAHALEVSLEK